MPAQLLSSEWQVKSVQCNHLAKCTCRYFSVFTNSVINPGLRSPACLADWRTQKCVIFLPGLRIWWEDEWRTTTSCVRASPQRQLYLLFLLYQLYLSNLWAVIKIFPVQDFSNYIWSDCNDVGRPHSISREEISWCEAPPDILSCRPAWYCQHPDRLYLNISYYLCQHQSPPPPHHHHTFYFQTKSKFISVNTNSNWNYWDHCVPSSINGSIHFVQFFSAVNKWSLEIWYKYEFMWFACLTKWNDNL